MAFRLTAQYGQAIGQDEPALGWDLEPLEPLILHRAVTLRMHARIDCIMAQMRRAVAARDPHTQEGLCVGDV
jgi:hypothetical protein